MTNLLWILGNILIFSVSVSAQTNGDSWDVLSCNPKLIDGECSGEVVFYATPHTVSGVEMCEVSCEFRQTNPFMDLRCDEAGRASQCVFRMIGDCPLKPEKHLGAYKSGGGTRCDAINAERLYYKACPYITTRPDKLRYGCVPNQV